MISIHRWSGGIYYIQLKSLVGIHESVFELVIHHLGFQ